MTTDKRAAAIAALIVRDVAEIPDRCSPDDQPEMMLVTSDELTHIVMRRLAALEADDGRALLRQLREWAQNTGQHQVAKLLSDSQGIFAWKWCWTPLLAEIDRLLAAPEQPAPEPAAPANHDKGRVCLICGEDVPSGERYSHGYGVCMPVAADEPAAPHADDEARIAEILRKHAKGWTENDRLLIDDALLLATDTIRDLAAGKAKAEALAHERTEVFSKVEAQNAAEIANLRKKLADAKAELAAVDAAIADRGVPERDCSLPLPERVSNIISELKNWRHEAGTAQVEVERLRGRDAEPFDWDAAPSVQEWIDENLPEREPRAGSKMIELHPDEVIADRGESRRVAGWLKDLMAENAKLRAERDAALAAQNARAVEELEKVLTLIRDEWREADTTQCLKSWVDGWLRDRLTVLGAVVDLDRQTEPAAEPVPAAADAKPGDEVLRKVWDALRNTPHAAVSLEQQKWCIAVERVVCELVDRALEVRP